MNFRLQNQYCTYVKEYMSFVSLGNYNHIVLDSDIISTKA